VSASAAAHQGFVDEVIEPRDTRRRLAGALGGLSHGGQFGNGPGNIPL
jgi:acetyl-CoA carboxylase carboxyltransferase component